MNFYNSNVNLQKWKSFIVTLFIITYHSSCSNLEQEDTLKTNLSLITINDSLHYLQIKTDTTLDKWKLPYPVYQFQTGDINNNGSDEMIVGVIKKTRFDTVMGKRLFIFKNYKGFVRPLWLGSKLANPLVDYRFIKTKNGSRIRSVEKEKNGKYLVAEYKWRKFGMETTRYILREVDMNQAMEELKQIK